MKARHFTAIALLMLAPAAWAGDDVSPSVATPAAESQTQPKNSCSVPCLVMRVSTTTKCECTVRKTLPA